MMKYEERINNNWIKSSVVLASLLFVFLVVFDNVIPYPWFQPSLSDRVHNCLFFLVLSCVFGAVFASPVSYLLTKKS